MKSDIFDNFFEDKYCEQKQEKRMSRKWIKTAAKYSNVLTEIIYPHRYQADDGCYGENDLNAVLKKHPDKIMNWPQVPNFINVNIKDKKKTIDNLVEFFNTKFYQQLNDYVKYLINNNIMMSEQYIKHLPMIDITRNKDIKFTNEDINILRNHGKDVFNLIASEYVIKPTKNTYIRIVCDYYSEKDTTFTFQEYYALQHEWIMVYEMKVNMSFEEITENKLPVTFNFISYTDYSKIMTSHVPQMKWSDRQIALWHDMFSLVPYENSMIIQMDILDDNGIYHTSKEHLPMIHDISCNTSLNINVLATTETEIDRELVTHTNWTHYLIQYIAFSNLQLYKCESVEKYDSNKPDKQNVLLVKSVETTESPTGYKHILWANDVKFVEYSLTDMQIPENLKGQLECYNY